MAVVANQDRVRVLQVYFNFPLRLLSIVSYITELQGHFLSKLEIAYLLP